MHHSSLALTLFIVLFSLNLQGQTCTVPSPLSTNTTISNCSLGSGSGTLYLEGDETADTLFISGTVTWDYETLIISKSATLYIEDGATLNFNGNHIEVKSNSSLIVEGTITQNHSLINYGITVFYNDHQVSNISNYHKVFSRNDFTSIGAFTNSDSLKVGGDLNVVGAMSNYNAYVFAGGTIAAGVMGHVGTQRDNYTFPSDDEYWGYFGAMDLPVELISFSATMVDDAVTLKWSTASEINCERFIIEKSLDKKSWTEIGNQSGQGTTFTTSEYTFIDNFITQSSYYRLRQIDFDGREEVFGPIHQQLNTGNSTISMYPNHVVSGEFIHFQSSDQQPLFITITIFDRHGRKVYTNDHQSQNEQLSLDTKDLRNGMYFIHLQQGMETSVKKLIVN
ncbi:T9SS type A sorting domain-containing protein [Flammeovirga sp. SubArs3]|uniref:T9SS type A sorting domain-containing protein n=1 Tax=Flammeovirga sp. SubArs3 TaxID=2995316 RepID=UPI00248AF8E6|nr:T9SS type A sorting domain-containing protein [Flammeovirga sp. SubArs3]